MWKVIVFIGTFLRTLYQEGLIEGRRLPSTAEIKAEWVAFKRKETRVAPIGTTGRVFQDDPRCDPSVIKITPKLKASVTKIRVYRAKTDTYEIIEGDE